MQASFSRRGHFWGLIIPLLLLGLCACKPPPPKSNLKAKTPGEACALLAESLSLHNPGTNSGSVFVAKKDPLLPHEVNDERRTAHIPVSSGDSQTGRNFQLLGENGLFDEQKRDIPKTRAEFNLDTKQVDAKVDPPFIAEPNNDGVIVKFNPKSNAAILGPNGEPPRSQLSVTVRDACGKSATVNLLVVLDLQPKPATAADLRNQTVDGGGFGQASGSTGSNGLAFVTSGGVPSTESAPAQTGHFDQP